MSGTESHHDLVAYERGELEAAAAEAVSAHVADCAACAAELVEIRRVLEDVRSDSLAPSAAFRARLDAVLDAELAHGPGGKVISLRSRVREVWEFAQWRYENSVAVRRFVAASIVAHAAAVAMVAILLVERAGTPTFEPPNVAVRPSEASPELDEDAETPAPETDDPTDSLQPGKLNAAMRERLALVIDLEARDAHLTAQLGALAPSVTTAMEEGLDSLSETQFDDGSWGAPQLDRHVRAGTTAAVAMAFSLNNLDVDRRDSVFRFLKRYMDEVEAAEDSDFGDGKPVYAYALALRALTVDDAVNHAYRVPGAVKLLRRAASRLAGWQREDGGFGYTPRADRSDSSCTVFAAETLDWVRAAGVLDTTSQLERAGRFLAARRGEDGVLGYEATGDRTGDLGLTAALEALGPAVGVRRSAEALAAIETALQAPSSRKQDLLFFGRGVTALSAGDRSLKAPVTALLASRGDDGGWTDEGDRHCAGSGRDLATAMGVIGLARTYVN